METVGGVFYFVRVWPVKPLLLAVEDVDLVVMAGETGGTGT